MRMRISEIDALAAHIAEAEALQARFECGGRFVTERLAEGEVEGGGDPLLDCIPGVFQARGRVLFLDDEKAVVGEARAAACEERVPLVVGIL